MAENKKLFGEFSPVSTQEWEAKINTDLKGADYDKALIWKTYEGINVRPYYRKEDVENLNFLNLLPGEFPFIRGNDKLGNKWLIRQDIPVDDFHTANLKALEILGKGVNSLGFCFKNCADISVADLSVLLKDINPEAAEINFVCPCTKCNCVSQFVEFVKNSPYNPEKVLASCGMDPVGEFTLSGKLADGAFDNLGSLIEKSLPIKGLRVITVHGKYFAESGSSIVQELAFSLALGAEYLTQLTNLGLEAGIVAEKLKFNLGIGNNYFMEIAKLRAGRLLWAKIVKEYGIDNENAAKMIVHSETNAWNKTIYDPYVNLLRTQTEAMSAALGGTHSITVLPFNAVFENTNAFSERIARNQQILLKEESHLDKISDPSAGSYYIESLTNSIAEQALKLFMEVQEKGGFIAAFREGFIQNEISETASKRDKNISSRRENLLGTNQFPNFSESVSANLDTTLFQPTVNAGEASGVKTLKPYRGAQVFETLRYKTDVYARNHKRPVAFMLTMGNLAMRKARAQFMCNFFAVAGVKVIDNNGFASAQEGVNAAKAANADIIVVCSSDDEYADIVPQVANLVKNEILVVAGNPACRPQLEEKGVKNFIHVKSNILEELKSFQEQLGI